MEKDNYPQGAGGDLQGMSTDLQRTSTVSQGPQWKNKEEGSGLPVGTYQSGNSDDTASASQNGQSKRPKLLTKLLIVLFSIFSVFGIMACVTANNAITRRHSAISDAFSKEESTLEDSLYNVEIIKKDVDGGVMAVRLDGDIAFDYICEVRPFGLDSGYGPFCSYEFSDESASLGEYIFHKNYNYLQNLLTEYQDVLVVDNAEYIFRVKDQGKMQLFFSELMQNADFNKAYRAFRNLDDKGFSRNIDYIYIRGVVYGGEVYGGIGLFEWADYMGFDPWRVSN